MPLLNSYSSLPTLWIELAAAAHEDIAQTQLPFLLLPLEVRLMVYNYVFNSNTIVTGPLNKKTFARIYTVNQPQTQYELALLRTCNTIHDEIKKHVNPRSIVRNTSATGIVKHIHGECPANDYRIREPEILRRMMKLSVRIGIQRSGDFERFGLMASHMDAPLTLRFLKEAEPDGTPGLADRGWSWLLETFVRRSSGGNSRTQ